ncbi:MAG TPA: class I SAM-dependent methyltransferase [Casimicrobiaceae bacterium]|nr:class I SAM-dependent methyltransferase [Casimicrobiaceae bacterium]
MSSASPRLYRDLVPWYRLVDPTRDHEDEAASYQAALERVVEPSPRSLLELGAGAGNNAYFLKRRFQCTLTDASDAMLGLSRALNAECEHVVGDMRSLDLRRTFDVVLVHDAIMYMTTEDDLRAAAATAFRHARAGGAALFAPDCVRETFREKTLLLAEDDGPRSLRGIDWSWDPDPADDTFIADYVFMLRENASVATIHDRHVVGVFCYATWHRVLSNVGWEVERLARPIDEAELGDVFVCRKPRVLHR